MPRGKGMLPSKRFPANCSKLFPRLWDKSNVIYFWYFILDEWYLVQFSQKIGGSTQRIHTPGKRQYATVIYTKRTVKRISIRCGSYFTKFHAIILYSHVRDSLVPSLARSDILLMLWDNVPGWHTISLTLTEVWLLLLLLTSNKKSWISGLISNSV